MRQTLQKRSRRLGEGGEDKNRVSDGGGACKTSCKKAACPLPHRTLLPLQIVSFPPLHRLLQAAPHIALLAGLIYPLLKYSEK
jgi:hypothetical protein